MNYIDIFFLTLTIVYILIHLLDIQKTLTTTQLATLTIGSAAGVTLITFFASLIGAH